MKTIFHTLPNVNLSNRYICITKKTSVLVSGDDKYTVKGFLKDLQMHFYTNSHLHKFQESTLHIHVLYVQLNFQNCSHLHFYSEEVL